MSFNNFVVELWLRSLSNFVSKLTFALAGTNLEF